MKAKLSKKLLSIGLSVDGKNQHRPVGGVFQHLNPCLFGRAFPSVLLRVEFPAYFNGFPLTSVAVCLSSRAPFPCKTTKPMYSSFLLWNTCIANFYMCSIEEQPNKKRTTARRNTGRSRKIPSGSALTM